MLIDSRGGPGGPVGVLLVGGHGHGLAHLRTIERLGDDRVVRLAGVCDTRPPSGEAATLAAGADWFDDFETALRRTRAEIVVVSTPIHTHADLAERALLGGADVLLEKPPAATLADYRRLTAVEAETGRACQVGFQTLGSTAIDTLRELIAQGALGRVRGIGVFGAWVRTASYWTRTPWAGRRRMAGRDVCDGAVTNPFAHATATALRIDGSDRLGDLTEVTTQLYRANPIEADDTSCVRAVSRRGTTIAVGVTLCAAQVHEPYVVVHGERGRATFWYALDRLRVATPDGVTETDHTRTDLLADLARHVRDRSRPLAVPLARTGAFMQVLEAVRTAPAPVEIPPQHRRRIGAGPGRRYVVPGVEDRLEEVAMHLRTFAESGAPWAAGEVPVGSGAAGRVTP